MDIISYIQPQYVRCRATDKTKSIDYEKVCSFYKCYQHSQNVLKKEKTNHVVKKTM
jgi:hypothetical protein